MGNAAVQVIRRPRREPRGNCEIELLPEDLPRRIRYEGKLYILAAKPRGLRLEKAP